jgi:hypothetical protein
MISEIVMSAKRGIVLLPEMPRKRKTFCVVVVARLACVAAPIDNEDEENDCADRC